MDRQRVVNVQEALREAERDKNGIIVSNKQGIDFGLVERNPSVLILPRVELMISKIEAEGQIILADFRTSSSLRNDGQSTRYNNQSAILSLTISHRFCQLLGPVLGRLSMDQS